MVRAGVVGDSVAVAVGGEVSAVGVGAVAEEFGQEIQPFDAVDRVAEVFDTAREVEYHNERRVDLVGDESGQPEQEYRRRDDKRGDVH